MRHVTSGHPLQDDMLSLQEADSGSSEDDYEKVLQPSDMPYA